MWRKRPLILFLIPCFLYTVLMIRLQMSEFHMINANSEQTTATTVNTTASPAQPSYCSTVSGEEKKQISVSEKSVPFSWNTTAANSSQVKGKIFPPNANISLTVNSSYIIRNGDYCASFSKLLCVIIVHSAHNHFSRRMSIRQTWANPVLPSNSQTRTDFLLGTTFETVSQDSIYKEYEKVGDIVQGNFIDDYRNLTLKAVMGLRWVSEHCNQAKYILKVDDDVFLNVFGVTKFVFPALSRNQWEIVCHLEKEGPIFRPGKTKKVNYKWMVSLDYFKDYTTYPMPFCYGFATFFPFAWLLNCLRLLILRQFFLLMTCLSMGFWQVK